MSEAVFIVGAKRTAIGSFQGSLSSIASPQLAAATVKGVIEETGLSPEVVTEFYLGSVLTANQGQAPARQAALAAGLNQSTHCMTVNKVCSSGLISVVLGAQSIMLGDAEVVISSGSENMSQVPHYVPSLRKGQGLGNSTLVDGLIHDGLWDVYNDYHMGCAGELCAEKYGFDRESQDAFALESYKRAAESISQGSFAREICPVEYKKKGVSIPVLEDEEPGKLRADKVSSLSTVFKKDGTITAANASSLSDGAASLCLASQSAVSQYGLTPRAKILSYATFSQAPEWFTTAPVSAMSLAAEKAKKKISDFDFFEINEAFSSVAMACTQELSLESDVVNVRGGAVALGHPIGASGARILVSLLHILEDKGAKLGMIGICNGGGEATAMAIELV